jgi:hypothetical protein
MAWRNIRIQKAPDDENGHEQFYLVQLDTSFQPTQSGSTRFFAGTQIRRKYAYNPRHPWV